MPLLPDCYCVKIYVQPKTLHMLAAVIRQKGPLQMIQRRVFLGGIAILAFAGCTVPPMQKTEPRMVKTRSYRLSGLSFSAPQDLTISESESFYPSADIVWRGDPLGPRVDQIERIFETAVRRNTAVLTGAEPIDVEITLVRFHGVTNKTRYSVGGVYNVIFDMTVRDARSGAILEPARRIVGNLSAPGGERAVRLEESGQTQKVRVTDYLAGLVRAQLI